MCRTSQEHRWFVSGVGGMSELCPMPAPPGYGPCIKPRGHADLHDFLSRCRHCGKICSCMPTSSDKTVCGHTMAWAGYVNICDLPTGHEGVHSMEQSGTEPVTWFEKDD